MSRASISRASISLLVLFILQAPCFAGSLKVTPAEEVGMSSARLAAVKAHFEQRLRDEKTGGYQLLVSRRGEIVMYENLGLAKVEENIPVSEATLFRIYSMTKPIVGAAMMMLYEEGKYSFSDALSRHIPEFDGLQVYAGLDAEGNMLLEEPQREPTIHDLLQHTAGFTYGIFGDTPVDRQYRDKDILNYDQTLQQLIDKLATTPLLFQPGSKWEYSVAVDVQGYLIEKWTGMKLEDFLKERLFEPLGMDQTMAWVPPRQARLLADVYTHDEEGARRKFEEALAMNHLRPPGDFSGGGQLISTSDDYWRFCQMLLNGGEFDGVRYLSPRTVDLMTSNHLRDPISMPNGAGFGLNFGVVVDDSQTTYAASDGEYFWGGIASTVFWVDPREELVAILMTQYTPYRGQEYRDLFHRLVRAAIIE